MIYPDDILDNAFMNVENTGLSGTQDKTMPVFVQNPSPGGGDSNSIKLKTINNYAFTKPKRLYTTKSTFFGPDMAIDSKGNLIVIFPDLGGYYMISSNDKGNSWSGKNRITEKEGWFSALSIGTDDDLNVVYSCDEIYFFRSTDKGTSWTSPVKISDSVGWQDRTTIAANNSGMIGVAWIAGKPEPNNIYFSRSVNNGNSWSLPAKLTEGGNPRLCADSNGNYNLTFQHSSGIFVLQSTDNGKNWGEAIQIADGGSEPQILSDDSGNLNVAYHNDVTNLYFTRSTDSGNSWCVPVTACEDSSGYRVPGIAVDILGNSNIICMADLLEEGQRERVYNGLLYLRSIDNGQNWASPVRITDIEGQYSIPGARIQTDSEGVVYLLWSVSPGKADDIPVETYLYFCRSL